MAVQLFVDGPLFAEVCAELTETERQNMNLAVPAGEERGKVGTQKERIRPGKIEDTRKNEGDRSRPPSRRASTILTRNQIAPFHGLSST